MRLTTPSLLELSNLFERSGFGISSTEGECLRGITTSFWLNYGEKMANLPNQMTIYFNLKT